MASLRQERFFYDMEANETLEMFLDRHVRPDTSFLSKCGVVIDQVVRLLHRHPKYSVNQVIKGGSLGKGTGVRDHSDVDLLVVLNNFKSVEALSEDIRTVISNFKEYLTSTVDKKMGAKTGISIKGSTPYTLQFSVYCDDGTWIDVDLLPIVDVWSTWLLGLVGGVTSTYSKMEKEAHLRKYYAKCFAKLQIEFVKDRPARVKDLIRLMKYWKYTENIQLTSYAIELVVIYVWQKQGSANNFTMKTMISEVISVLVNYGKIAISWNINYDPKYYIRLLGKSPPYILDPANPFHDLASDPSFSWRNMGSGYYHIQNKAAELERKLNGLQETSSCVIS